MVISFPFRSILRMELYLVRLPYLYLYLIKLHAPNVSPKHIPSEFGILIQCF
jgi:hypothetical protein